MKHTLSCDTLGADRMGMGGAIRGAWECACPTETPTSRRLPMNGAYDDWKAKWDAAPCEYKLVGAVGAFWLLRKLL